MAYFPHAYQKLLVASSYYTTGGSLTTALTAGQLAVVNAETNLTIAATTAAAGTLTFANAPKMVYLAQGSFHANDKLGPHHGGYKETVKSKGINPKYVSAFYVVEDAPAKNNIISVCADGCNLTCNTTYRLRLDVKGSPALRFLTRNAYLTVDAKTSCCDPAVEGQIMDPVTVLLGWANGITGSPIMSNFVEPTVYVSNTTDSIGASATVEGTEGDSTITVTSVTGSIVVGQYVNLPNGQSGWVCSNDEGTVGLSTDPDCTNDLVLTSTITSTTDVAFYEEVTSEDYVEVTNQTTLGNLKACITLAGAYVSTEFGDCSFRPTDHFEIEPVLLYASTLDENEDPCDTICFTTSTVQDASQGKGYGETFLRELILAKQYQQEWWTNDVRLREVLDNTSLSEINRGNKYVVYNILHSIPRKSNPNGMMDNDQYLVRVVTPSRITNFEDYMDKLLEVNLNTVQLEVKA